MLREQFPDKRILRIDRETVADPHHAAYQCIDNLNTVSLEWDAIIASPVIESGVSIDLHGHFTGVWQWASGVIPTANVRQTSARLRDNDVPRHIWMPERAIRTSFVGNGSISPSTLYEGELKKAKTNCTSLKNAGCTVDFDGTVQNNAIALETWLKMACRINAGFHNYRSAILADLEAEGHSVQQLGLQVGKEEGKSISDGVTDSRDELKESEAQKVVEALPPQSEAEYERLKAEKRKTTEQRRSQLHWELQRRYLAPLDVDTVLKDWDGWYPQLRLHYYLTVGNEYLSDRDAKRFENIAQAGRSWIPDTNRALLSHKIGALKILGVDKLLVPGVDWSQDSPEVQDIVKKALACAKDIKLFLGVKVTPDSKPMSIVQEILVQTLGFRLERPSKAQFIDKGTDANGKRQRDRIYRFVPPEDRKEIFERWLLRDAEAAKQKTVSSYEQNGSLNAIDLINEFDDPNREVSHFSSSAPKTGEREGESSSSWEEATILQSEVNSTVVVNWKESRYYGKKGTVKEIVPETGEVGIQCETPHWILFFPMEKLLKVS